MIYRGPTPCRDIVVLDMADEQGSFCSKLLADLGATVLRAESPKANPISDPLTSVYHNANKLRFVLDTETRKGRRLLQQWMERADVLVETFPSEHKTALGLAPEQTCRLNPRLIHLSITGFGRTGPRRAYRSTDVVASAYGGQMYVTGTASGGPVPVFCRQSFYTASLFAANAALLHLRKRAITGKGCFLDLSIQEAVASALDPVMIQYFTEKTIAGRSTEDPDKSFFLLPCRDGSIQITLSRNWDTLLDLMRAEGKAADLTERKYQTASYRNNHHRHIMEVVQRWTKNHTKQELFKLGQTMQFPWAPVSSPEEIVRSPQLRSRKFFTPAYRPKGAETIFIPGRPYKLHSIGTKAPEPGTQSKHRFPSLKSRDVLSGIRVLDLTRMLSGPYATRILGDFGAEIIKVQSITTARGAEQNGTPYFRAWNRNKRSISLNLNRPEARDIFLKLVAISDVVVENFSPRVLENLGLTYRDLGKVKPDLIMASISAMGRTGPWKHYVGYAPTFHALSGMTHSVIRAAGSSAEIGNSYGDIVAGLYAALTILAAIHHRENTGQGQSIDLSAYESACTVLGPILPEKHSTPESGSRYQAQGNTRDDFGGCYRCAGEDRWCVFHIFNETEWRAFCRVCRRPELQSRKFSKPEARQKHRSELDALIAQWAARHKAENLVGRLQNAGIAAGVVQNAEDLANDRQLEARHFFINPENFGKDISDRSVLWPWKEKSSGWKTAPRLGEANEYVYQTLLGYSASQYLALKKQGVIR